MNLGFDSSMEPIDTNIYQSIDHIALKFYKIEN